MLVTSTVQMLVLGSGITFAGRGEHALKGVPASGTCPPHGPLTRRRPVTRPSTDG